MVAQPNRKQSSSKAAEDRKPFPFMKLPMEIRTMIYKQHLTLPRDVAISKSPWRKPALFACICLRPCVNHWNRGCIRCSLGFLCRLWLVSKNIYNESHPIFFDHNSFCFQDLNLLSEFLLSIGPNARRSLRSLLLSFHGGAPAKAMKLLKGCVGLQELSISFSDRSSPSISALSTVVFPLTRFPGMSDLLKIRGLTELKISINSTWSFHGGTKYNDLVARLREALKVLKGPYTRTQLRDQKKQDYPQKATRTVFGLANVTTRAEKKLISAQSAATAGIGL